MQRKLYVKTDYKIKIYECNYDENKIKDLKKKIEKYYKVNQNKRKFLLPELIIFCKNLLMKNTLESRSKIYNSSLFKDIIEYEYKTKEEAKFILEFLKSFKFVEIPVNEYQKDYIYYNNTNTLFEILSNRIRNIKKDEGYTLYEPEKYFKSLLKYQAIHNINNINDAKEKVYSLLLDENYILKK